MSTLIRFLLGFSLVLTSLFLILLVLIQRGRGGGLAGALGGMGGQSAFGTKAGDVFTRITVGVAAVWILLCILTLTLLREPESLLAPGLGGAAAPAVPPRQMQPPAQQPPTGQPPAGQSSDIAPAVPETKPAGETKPATESTPAAETKSAPDATPATPEAKPATGGTTDATPPAAAAPAAQPEPTK